MTEFCVIIPARYDSSRLPGKVMLEIDQRPMLDYVVQIGRESGAGKVVVATDDERVSQWCKVQQIECYLTSSSHCSGSDRLAEAVDLIGLDDSQIVVNLQGDEPLMPAKVVSQVAETLESKPLAQVSTACAVITDATELHSPHAVKVIFNEQGYALYFSRAPIPWHRDVFAMTPGALPKQPLYYRHFGIYAYRAGFLRKMGQLKAGQAEMAESLEQLRIIRLLFVY